MANKKAKARPKKIARIKHRTNSGDPITAQAVKEDIERYLTPASVKPRS